MTKWFRYGVVFAFALLAALAVPSPATAQVHVGVSVGAPFVSAPIVRLRPRVVLAPTVPYYYPSVAYPYRYPYYGYPYYGYSHYGYGYAYGYPYFSGYYRSRGFYGYRGHAIAPRAIAVHRGSPRGRR